MVDKEKNLSQKLKSTNSEEVFGALKEIKEKYVRYKDKMKQLQKYSVIKLLISLIEHPKYCSITLSIIADGCIESNFVNEVIQCEGVQSLMNIMKSFIIDDIKSKACRALGNMAKFEIGLKAVLLMNPIPMVVNFLSETLNNKCKEVAVRTLMILGKSSKAKELIVEKNGIIYIAKLLNEHNSNVNLLICSTRAFASLTEDSDLSFARLLSHLQILKYFVQLYSHPNKLVSENAFISLINLTVIEKIRFSLVKSGAVGVFTNVVSTCKSKEMNQLAAFALCKCLDHLCHWPNNGTDGLKALISILKNNVHQDIHLQVIKSVLPLAYSNKVSNILLKLNILEILIKLLESYVEKHKCNSFEISCLSPSSNPINNENSRDDKMRTDFHFDIDDCQKSMKAEASNMDIDNTCPFIPSPPVSLICSDYIYNFSTEFYDYSSGNSSSDRLNSPKFYHSSFIKSNINSGSSSSWSLCFKEWEERKNIWSDGFSGDSICSSPTFSTCSNNLSMNSPSRTVSPDIRHVMNISSDQLSPSQEGENSPNQLLSPDIRYDSVNSGQWSPIVENEKLSSNSLFYSPTSTIANVLPSTSKSNDLEEPPSKLLKICNTYEFSHNMEANIHSVQKKVKTEYLNKDLLKYQSQDSTGEPQDSTPNCNFLSDKEHLTDQEIDYFILNFLRKLYSSLEKNTNSQMADKPFFTVLIDYLCFMHNPCSQAETILINLIKNRYFFEKLISNGFMSELDEKFSSSYSCIAFNHQTCVNEVLKKIKQVGGREAESNFGIGTLSHILATSSKMKKLNTICAISKLVTQKSSLHKLLFQAKGLSLLLNFLIDSDIITRRRAIVSLCELYQILTKKKERKKCCVLDTCNLKASLKCSYKESCFNVTFLLKNGVQIVANREKICENSDYFNRLLNGYFLEKEAQQITLSDISEKNLIIIFHFLHGCGSSSYCPYIKRLPFCILLELLSDCDRLLLLNIKSFVEDRLCHYIFPSTVSKIYRQSNIHNSSTLMKRSLDFALNMNILKKDTLYNTFDELLNLEQNLNFLSEVENVINNLFQDNKE